MATPDYTDAAYCADEAHGMAVEATDATRRMLARLPEDAPTDVVDAAEKADTLAGQLREALEALTAKLG
jgi:hypothetical protein